MAQADRSGGIEGIDRLTPTEKNYYEAFQFVINVGNVGSFLGGGSVGQLLTMGHVEDYDGVLKLTESGFQLFDFLQFKMTGKKRPEPEERYF